MPKSKFRGSNKLNYKAIVNLFIGYSGFFDSFKNGEEEISDFIKKEMKNYKTIQQFYYSTVYYNYY